MKKIVYSLYFCFFKRVDSCHDGRPAGPPPGGDGGGLPPPLLHLPRRPGLHLHLPPLDPSQVATAPASAPAPAPCRGIFLFVSDILQHSFAYTDKIKTPTHSCLAWI